MAILVTLCTNLVTLGFNYFNKELSRLSLGDPYMAFSETTLQERKHEIWDIISSFDRFLFAAEYRLEIWEQITEHQLGRPLSDLTISEDLTGTLLQAACHDLEIWNGLNRLYTPPKRAKLFTEKLKRRFEGLFNDYETLTRAGEREPGRTRLPEASTIGLEEIFHDFRRFAAIACNDLKLRLEGRASTLIILLDVLKRICQNASGLQSMPQSSLYHRLIHEAPTNQRTFMLDALDAIRDTRVTITPRDLSEIAEYLRAIAAALSVNAAPAHYQRRLQEVRNAVEARAE
ncbi:hypothetical protein LTR99_009820 [Exophiala xenobiotica]|nr:hypothetical protein LTR96_010664 [Exophiala xenobiotica]KAK5293374.1 hypothetical protein LTR99_009820 [Exophiala xenobiotica]KAK5429893.1 hypothetical protein LTR34_006594 [Exophiala xenobiotica]